MPTAAGRPTGRGCRPITCAYLVEGSAQWVMQSLFLAAIADVRERGGKAIEAFLPIRRGRVDRAALPRTVFPNDFLADFGFRTVRRLGRVELARLELGGLVPVEEKAPAKLLRRVRKFSSLSRRRSRAGLAAFAGEDRRAA